MVFKPINLTLRIETVMELLGHMNPKVMSWSARVDGDPLGHLSSHDIAAALGRIRGDDGPSTFLRAKYCNDAREARKLLALIGGSIITSHEVPAKYQTMMARLVFEHSLMPPLCPVCRGTKEVRLHEKVIVCHECEGSGVGEKTDAYMSSFINCTKAEWQGGLEQEYCQLMALTERWEQEGRKAILDALLFD